MLTAKGKALTEKWQTLTERCESLTETLNRDLNSIQGSASSKFTSQSFGDENERGRSPENAFEHVLEKTDHQFFGIGLLIQRYRVCVCVLRLKEKIVPKKMVCTVVKKQEHGAIAPLPKLTTGLLALVD